MSQQNDQTNWNDLSGLDSSTRSGVVSDLERSQYLPLTEDTGSKLHSNAGQAWSQSSNQTPMLDPHLNPKSDRGYETQDPLTSITEPGLSSHVTTTATPLYQHEVSAVQSPSWQTSQPQSQSIVDKGKQVAQQGMQVAQQGMQKLGLTSGSSSQGPSMVDKGAAVIQQGMQKLSNVASSSTQQDRPILERTDDREITLDQGPVQKLKQSLQSSSSSQSDVSPLEKLLNTFNLMDSLESGMSSAGESVIPSMKNSLAQYEETIRNLVTIMEGSEQGQRIIRHLTEMINIIQDYLEEFAPPTDSHAAQQWVHKLNLRLKRINVEPSDNMTEVLALFGLNEAMDRMETTPGLPILLSRLGRVMKICGRNKMTEHQTKTILKDAADLATVVAHPAGTVLDESQRAVGKIQEQGGIKEAIKQLATQPSDPDSIQDFVDTIKEWTLSIMTTVLPTVKIPQYEGETPSIMYKVGKIDLSNVNITRDMVNVSVDHQTGQIFTKVAGVDVNVYDLPWRVKHKKLKITSSGLADATTKDATWSMGLGLNYNTQVPDIPAIVLTSPPCLKLGAFDVTVKHSKLSPLANMFMGLFKRSIRKTIENRVEEEIERSMIQSLDNLNIAIQKTAPRLKRLVELGRLLVFKGQETTQHIHEREKSIEHDEFESYQPGESDEYESEDMWDRDFSIYQHTEQTQPLLEQQPIITQQQPTVVHTYQLPPTLDVPRAEPLQSSWDSSSVGSYSSDPSGINAGTLVRDFHADISHPDWEHSYTKERGPQPPVYFPESAAITTERDLSGGSLLSDQSQNIGSRLPYHPASSSVGQTPSDVLHSPPYHPANVTSNLLRNVNDDSNPTLGSSLSGGVSPMGQDTPYSDISKPGNLSQSDSRLGEGDHGLRQHAYRMQSQGGNDRA